MRRRVFVTFATWQGCRLSPDPEIFFGTCRTCLCRSPIILIAIMKTLVNSSRTITLNRPTCRAFSRTSGSRSGAREISRYARVREMRPDNRGFCRICVPFVPCSFARGSLVAGTYVDARTTTTTTPTTTLTALTPVDEAVDEATFARRGCGTPP